MVHALWKRLHAIAVIMIATITLLPSVALANDICRAVALRDVAAIQAPDSIIPRGGYDGRDHAVQRQQANQDDEFLLAWRLLLPNSRLHQRTEAGGA